MEPITTEDRILCTCFPDEPEKDDRQTRTSSFPK